MRLLCVAGWFKFIHLSISSFIKALKTCEIPDLLNFTQRFNCQFYAKFELTLKSRLQENRIRYSQKRLVTFKQGHITERQHSTVLCKFG